MRTASALLGVFFCFFALQSAHAQSAYRALVTRVVDGDTVWVQPESGGQLRKLRIDGIDAPEICQADGSAARDVLRSLIHRQWVGVQVRTQDVYGRDLAQLTWQNQDVGDWLVRQGWAWSYRFQGEPGPFAVQEEQARKNRVGVHRQPKPMYPGSFRQLRGPCHLR